MAEPIPNNVTPVVAVAPKSHLVVGVIGVVLAVIAIFGPIAFWVIAALPAGSNPQGTYGLVALGLVGAVLYETFVTLVAGIASLILAIIAVIKPGTGRKLAITAFIINAATFTLFIAQTIYWASLSS